MDKSTYTQCRMERKNADGSKSIHTAFIPTSFAKIGRNVELHVSSPEDEEGTWSKGWVVVERGGTQSKAAVDLQRSARNTFATKLDRR